MLKRRRRRRVDRLFHNASTAPQEIFDRFGDVVLCLKPKQPRRVLTLSSLTWIKAFPARLAIVARRSVGAVVRHDPSCRTAVQVVRALPVRSGHLRPSPGATRRTGSGIEQARGEDVLDRESTLGQALFVVVTQDGVDCAAIGLDSIGPPVVTEQTAVVVDQLA